MRSREKRCPLPPTLRSLTLTLGTSPMPNSGHTATLRSAKIRQNRTSCVRKPLGDITCNKKGCGDMG